MKCKPVFPALFSVVLLVLSSFLPFTAAADAPDTPDKESPHIPLWVWIAAAVSAAGIAAAAWIVISKVRRGKEEKTDA